MSTPNKKSEPAKKSSPTSITDLFQEVPQKPAFQEPYSLLDSLVKDKDIVISEDDPAILFVYHEFLVLAIAAVSHAPNPPTFLGSPELPAGRDELAARIMAHCQAQIGGAGANASNHLLYNSNVGNFAIVSMTLADVRRDPFIDALRQELGGPVFICHVLPSKILIGATVEV